MTFCWRFSTRFHDCTMNMNNSPSQQNVRWQERLIKVGTFTTVPPGLVQPRQGSRISVCWQQSQDAVDKTVPDTDSTTVRLYETMGTCSTIVRSYIFTFYHHDHSNLVMDWHTWIPSCNMMRHVSVVAGGSFFKTSCHVYNYLSHHLVHMLAQ